jgi:hypothetical protein
MRKHIGLCAAALLLAGAAWAADEETGKVVSIDAAAGTFTLETDDGDRIAYRTEPSTRLQRDGTTVQLGDVDLGARVEVTAPEAEGTAPRMASEIELVDATDAGTRMGGEAEVAAEAGPRGAGVRADADVDVDDDDRLARSELPRTAGPLPLIGLLGVSAVVAGLLIRRLRR